MKYYEVTSAFFDSGHVRAAITDTIEADRQPANTYKSEATADIYRDYFRSYAAARAWVRDAKTA